MVKYKCYGMNDERKPGSHKQVTLRPIHSSGGQHCRSSSKFDWLVGTLRVPTSQSNFEELRQCCRAILANRTINGPLLLVTVEQNLAFHHGVVGKGSIKENPSRALLQRPHLSNGEVQRQK